MTHKHTQMDIYIYIYIYLYIYTHTHTHKQKLLVKNNYQYFSNHTTTQNFFKKISRHTFTCTQKKITISEIRKHSNTHTHTHTEKNVSNIKGK